MFSGMNNYRAGEMHKTWVSIVIPRSIEPTHVKKTN